MIDRRLKRRERKLIDLCTPDIRVSLGVTLYVVLLMVTSLLEKTARSFVLACI